MDRGCFSISERVFVPSACLKRRDIWIRYDDLVVRDISLTQCWSHVISLMLAHQDWSLEVNSSHKSRVGVARTKYSMLTNSSGINNHKQFFFTTSSSVQLQRYRICGRNDETPHFMIFGGVGGGNAFIALISHQWLLVGFVAVSVCLGLNWQVPELECTLTSHTAATIWINISLM